MTITNTIGQLHTLEGMHVLRQWDETCSRGWLEATQSLEQIKKGLPALAARWRKESDQYMKQVREARERGTPWQGMLAMADALRLCAKELEEFADKGVSA